MTNVMALSEIKIFETRNEVNSLALTLNTTPLPLMFESNEEVIDKNLIIYYINLDQSIERRRHFEQEMSRLPSHLLSTISLNRVHGLSNTSIKKMFAQGRLNIDGVEARREIDNLPIRYTESKLACILSHLTAILQAYRDGVGSALIVEDDAHVTADFLDNWKGYSMENNFTVVNKQCCRQSKGSSPFK